MHDIEHESRAWNVCCAEHGEYGGTHLYSFQLQQETGNALEPSDPTKGDDPWLTPLTPSLKAACPPRSRPANAQVSSVASSPRCWFRVKFRRIARSSVICATANSPMRRSARSNGVFCQRRRTFEVHNVDLSGSRARDVAARRLRSRYFILHDLRRGFPRHTARGRGRPQALSVRRLVRRDQAAPSTTRMSRSTLPVPSALSASL